MILKWKWLQRCWRRQSRLLMEDVVQGSSSVGIALKPRTRTINRQKKVVKMVLVARCLPTMLEVQMVCSFAQC